MEFQDFDVFVTDMREESADDRTIARFRIHVKDVETEGVETTLDVSALLDQLESWTSLKPTWSDIISVGRLLGDALFPTGRIREALLESLVKPRRRESRLRITFNMGPLSKYPWEFAVVPTEKGETTQHDILALNSQVSLIRLIDLAPLGVSSLKPVSPPLQMVMALSNPKGTPRLRLDREKKVIQESIGQSERVHLTCVDKAQATDYLAGLANVSLFHFAGHGSFEELPTAGEVSGKGVIWLEGPNNTSVSVDAPTLALKLADADVRVAVLGACLTAKHDDIHVWSSIATSLLKAGTGAVVAMQYAVEDATAIEFARGFYESLAMGFPIDQAVTKGRLAICEKGDARGIGTPVLYMRKSDGIIFPNLTNDPTLAAEREKTHVVVKLSAGLVEGELTGIDITTMSGGEAESTVNVDHVAAGGIVTGFKGGTLSGGNVNVTIITTTVEKDAKVVGVNLTDLTSFG
jgi:hypothetical protein